MAVDIFAALDALFAGQRLEEYPSPWIIQRFLASDPDFARAANEIQNEIRGPEETFLVWQAIVRPMHLTKAPKLSYVGQKKEAAPESLVRAMMERKNVRRPVAEQMIELLTLLGAREPTARELGVEL